MAVKIGDGSVSGAICLLMPENLLTRFANGIRDCDPSGVAVGCG